MAINLCPFSTKPCLNMNQKTMSNISEHLDSSFENENLEEFLKKNDFDPEWMVTSEIVDCNLYANNEGIQVSDFTKNSMSWCSSTFSLLRDKNESKVTKSVSNLKVEMENTLEEQFNLFNVSMPDLISGHICQDVCVCFCNSKLKQANKLRHVILMCTSHTRQSTNDSSSTMTSVSSKLTSLLSSSSTSTISSMDQLYQEYSHPPLSITPQFLSSVHQAAMRPGKCHEYWSFSDDSAILSIRCAKMGRLHRHHSCPMESYRLISLFESSQLVNALNSRILNLLNRTDVLLGWGDFVSIKRIQNEISVIQLKHGTIKKDYHRRKWAKLEERKIIENYGRIDEKTKKKKIERIDYQLLKLGEKFREDSEAIKQLFNAEHDKISLLCSKHQKSLEASTDGIIQLSSIDLKSCEKLKDDVLKECQKNYLKSEKLDKLLNHLETDLMKADINKDIDLTDGAIHEFTSHGYDDDPHNDFECSNLEHVLEPSGFSEKIDFINSEPLLRFRGTFFHKDRPLTRYLPIKGEETNFNLRQFIEQAGHCLDLCQEVKVTTHCACGFLKKVGKRLKTWGRRWFVFDRNQRQLLYYSDKSEFILRGRIHFQVVQDVYIDTSMLRCANSKPTFCLKTLHKVHILAAPSNMARQIWMDILFTGAEAYQDYLI